MHIDSRAVKLFFRKDEAAISAIYASYFGLLKHLSFQLVSDMELAEDCAQEAFLRLLQNGYEPKSYEVKPFLSYLCETVKTISLDALKKKKPLPLEEDVASSEPIEYGDDLLDLLQKELGQNEFDALVMHVCLGLPFDQIGIAMGVSASAARGLAHRGKEKAKARMKKEEWL